MADTHVTAPTRFVQVGGVRLAYRRFGKEVGTPLLFLQHFRGSMDNWDPAVTDGFARERPVILYDNTGVSSSSGETPSTVEEMTEDTAAFLKALGISSVDLLGFSMGGYTAQTLSLKHPTLVRKLVLVATGPRGGEPSQDPKVAQLARGERTLEEFLYLFFSPSARSQAAGRAFWERRHLRQRDVDPLSSPQTMAAQTAAGAEWRTIRGERYAELKNIAQPTLVVNGNRDIMIPTINAYTLSQHIPNAQLIVYPDSGHGSLFQYPELFVRHVTLFLEGLGRTDG
jgi:pimeloyl-ACP methyl ester carboxylesterase